MMRKLVINIFTGGTVNNQKIVLFSKNARYFIKSVSAYQNPKEFFCDSPENAFNFQTIEKAKEFINESGFMSLTVLILPTELTI